MKFSMSEITKIPKLERNGRTWTHQDRKIDMSKNSIWRKKNEFVTSYFIIRDVKEILPGNVKVKQNFVSALEYKKQCHFKQKEFVPSAKNSANSMELKNV